MFPQSRHPTPHQAAGQPFKFTIPESLDRIKEEFQFLQAQYHSLKLECEKLASEKTEMQRHYVMYYEMSYGLNIEMHKQPFDILGKQSVKAAYGVRQSLIKAHLKWVYIPVYQFERNLFGLHVYVALSRALPHMKPSNFQTEIAKRLNTICAQVIPFLSQEFGELSPVMTMMFLPFQHQQQVAQAVERAKQVTMAELNAIIGVRGLPGLPPTQQQLQAQHLSHGHGPPVPLTPHPSGLQPPGIPPLGSSAGLLALSSALGGQSHLALKDDKKHHDTDHHRGERHGKPD
ncbi:hypothetical protein lerEdw1_000192 [Lerista edwardsae]|nr:hypothetical protein lerEdw1_000192 [Lerista edwardsae]